MNGFKYRTFYSWDHSTNWDLNQPGIQIHGCARSYDKPSNAFIEDYKRLTSYMSKLGLNHLIIWGALRDSHGGVDNLKKLIEYSKAKGVRIAPGVGINCYGGVYYEGKNEFSLARMLRKHPERVAIDNMGNPKTGKNNQRLLVACPRNEKVKDWNLRGIRWLMEEVEPEAVHFETGDYGVCHCKICSSSSPREEFTSDYDMAEVLPPIIEQVRSLKSDCWISYNHYQGYTRNMMKNHPPFASKIPDDVICKWGVSWMLEPQYILKKWSKETSFEFMSSETKPPTKTNMAHIHFGTGWWNCSPRGTLEITRFFKYIPLISNVGFQGICTHGEESNLNPSCELNYHVFAGLADNPNATPQDMTERSLVKIYGERNKSLMIDVLTAFKERKVPSNIPPKVASAASVAKGQRKVRLNWLTFELHRLMEDTRRKK